MERKTVNLEDVRNILNLNKREVSIYLRLGILTPVAGTENSETPMYYTDEVATLREVIIGCQKGLKTLNNIRDNIKDEIIRANSALSTLQIDAATKAGAVNSLIDSIFIFFKTAIPQLKDNNSPLYLLRWADSEEDVKRIIEEMKGVPERNTPQEFLNNLYQKVELMDATSIRDCMVERDKLIKERFDLVKERDDLEKKVSELMQKVAMLSDESESNTFLTKYQYNKKLSEKQIEGLKKNISECDFTNRIYFNLKHDLPCDKNEITLADIVALNPKKLGEIRNLGKSSIYKIKDKLAEYDLTIGMDIVEIGGIYYSK